MSTDKWFEVWKEIIRRGRDAPLIIATLKSLIDLFDKSFPFDHKFSATFTDRGVDLYGCPPVNSKGLSCARAQSELKSDLQRTPLVHNSPICRRITK